MRKNDFALRLQPSLLDKAREVTQYERVAANQLINVAVAEKLSANRTKRYFGERGRRADVEAALDLLDRAGREQPPAPGDEL